MRLEGRRLFRNEELELLWFKLQGEVRFGKLLTPGLGPSSLSECGLDSL